MNTVNKKGAGLLIVLAIAVLFITAFNAVFGLVLAITFIINGLIYFYITDKYNKEQNQADKLWLGLKRSRLIAILLIAAFLGLALVIYARISTPEDTWLCQNGQWIKHGQPNAPQPTKICK